jgi:hypothetical protein
MTAMRTGYGGGFLYINRREDEEDEDEEEDNRRLCFDRADAADNVVNDVGDIVP